MKNEIFQTKRHVDDPNDDGVSLETQRISCQYPIIEIMDLSPNHSENTNENTWKILQPYPTKDEVNEKLDNTLTRLNMLFSPKLPEEQSQGKLNKAMLQ